MSTLDDFVDYQKLRTAFSNTLSSLRALQATANEFDFCINSPFIASGYSDVYLAIHRGRRVAVKKLRPIGPLQQRLRVAAALARELRTLCSLFHENILPLVSFLFAEDDLSAAWIVTPWQNHGNILDYVNSTQPNEFSRLGLARDTVKGLAYLHGRSPPVVHGDIKPENTLISDQGRAMLCDFGLARVIGTEPSGLTTPTPRIGTVRYTSPEVLDADDPRLTRESDIWALGCLLLVVMTDRKPYDIIYSAPSIIRAIVKGIPPAIPDQVTTNSIIKSLILECWKPAGSRPLADRCARSLDDVLEFKAKQ